MLDHFLEDFRNIFKSSPLYLIKRYFFLTTYGVLKYLPTPFGDIIRGLFLKLFLKKLNTIWIREGVTFHFPENISIGRSIVSEFVYLNGFGGIEIGDKVMIGANTMFFAHDHIFGDLSKPMWSQGLAAKSIKIEDNVYIGCNVLIMGGVIVHEGAVIGAGSVVTKDVPSNTVVAGVPAKVVSVRS